MLSLGKADCALATFWYGSQPVRVLVDGGNRGSADKVLEFLQQDDLRVNHIDHVVCSHPHDDHAGGLIGLVEDGSITFGQAWMHLPGRHVDLGRVDLALSRRASFKTAQVVEKSLETTNELLAAFKAKRIPVEEPFEGSKIAFLEVCGPSQAYYQSQVVQFSDEGAIETLEMAKIIDLSKAETSDVLSETPVTTPQNNSSTILSTFFDGDTYLLTADAGADALRRAAQSYQLESLRWMQLPHHGSRHNISPSLISHFRPQTACVSAPGTRDHPRRAVVNAFKSEGSAVYSTHYPRGGANLWEHTDDVPPRANYTASATPLYDAG